MTTLFCDGASRGNPGPAAYGYVVYQNSESIAEEGGFIGITTNNVAEYEGLLRGLEKCLKLGIKELAIRMDSELIVKQLQGKYKVKSPHLLPLFKKAKSFLQNFEQVEVQHVPRAENAKADSLANEALDAM